jgi:hypothetical protein
MNVVDMQSASCFVSLVHMCQIRVTEIPFVPNVYPFYNDEIEECQSCKLLEG